MSSSYGALNQKYNTLLALVLEGTGGTSIVHGKISPPTYSATTPTLYSFPTAFTGTVPNVVLTFDNGSSLSPTIIIVGLASVTLSGFYYLLSAPPPVGSSLNWFATQ